LFTSSHRVLNKLYLMIWDYYASAELDVPADLPQREVATQTYDGKMIRHMSVNDVDELRRLVISRKGIDLYVSTASYQNPSAQSMEAKGWLRADLQFDIDVDHLPGCGPAYKICGDDLVPTSDECTGEPVGIIPVECLYGGFEQALKLVRVLKKYFGIDEGDVEIHFSGNRGFHVVARNTSYDDADQAVRREIVDFVVGDLLKRESFCLEPDCLLPRPSDPGWRGRLGEALTSLVPEGLSTWGEVDDPELLFERALSSAKIEVDKQVTVDTSRLMRVPGSAHRKSALMVKKVKKFVWDETLSPFVDYETVVKALYNMDIKALDKRVKLRKGEKASLRGPQGAFLASKGLVEILRFDRLP